MLENSNEHISCSCRLAFKRVKVIDTWQQEYMRSPEHRTHIVSAQLQSKMGPSQLDITDIWNTAWATKLYSDSGNQTQSYEFDR